MDTDFYIEFILDDDFDDCECILSIDELRAMGIEVDRHNLPDDEWIIWS